jgi:hypothetical protein
MRPQLRAVFLLATFALVVAGLLLAGPAHLGVHKPGDATSCEACAVHGATPTPALSLPGAPRSAQIRSVPPPAAAPEPPSHLFPAPRGPPRGNPTV